MFHNVKKRLSKKFTETKKTFTSLRQINLEAQLIVSAKKYPYLKITIKGMDFTLAFQFRWKSFIIKWKSQYV